jgi:hypothetical protein
VLGGSRRVIVGAPGKTYSVTVWAAQALGGYWCAGPAWIWVGSETLNNKNIVKVYKKIEFRILRAP